jgi:uncharacterized protein HemX
MLTLTKGAGSTARNIMSSAPTQTPVSWNFTATAGHTTTESTTHKPKPLPPFAASSPRSTEMPKELPFPIKTSNTETGEMPQHTTTRPAAARPSKKAVGVTAWAVIIVLAFGGFVMLSMQLTQSRSQQQVLQNAIIEQEKKQAENMTMLGEKITNEANVLRTEISALQRAVMEQQKAVEQRQNQVNSVVQQVQDQLSQERMLRQMEIREIKKIIATPGQEYPTTTRSAY